MGTYTILMPDVGEGKRAGLQQQATVEARVTPSASERGNAAEAGAHQATGRGLAAHRVVVLDLRHELLGQELSVRRIVRILRESIAGTRQGDDHRRHFETMNQVVEHDLEIGEAQVVVTVVHHQQRVTSAAAKPCRQKLKNP